MIRTGLGLPAALALSAAAGALVALQSRYNGELGAAIDDPYMAAFISCTVGLGALLALVSVTPRARTHLRESVRLAHRGELPLWALSGGFAGSFLVVAQSAAVGALGVSLFAVSSVAGQTVAGLVLDRAGIGSEAPMRITPLRALGAALAVASVLVAGLSALRMPAASWLVLLPMVAGAGTGWQQAVNGRLRRATGSALSATVLNFTVGWIGLVVVLAVVLPLHGLPVSWPADPLPYLGGVLGIAYVGLSTYVVRTTGVLLLGLALVAGQLAASVLLDALLPVGPAPGPAVAIGILLSLAAILVASAPGLRRSARAVRSAPRRQHPRR